MVKHEIHHHLDAVLVTVLNESLVLFVGTETRVDSIVVGDGITVVAAARHVVDMDRSRPDGSHAKFLQIVESIVHTLEVAAMTSPVVSLINSRFLQSLYII